MSFTFLTRWFTASPRPRPDLNFLLYTRSACPLCDVALELLVRYQKRYAFKLEMRDVDEATEIADEFGAWVPVVAINGQVRFRGQINEVLLKRMLDAG